MLDLNDGISYHFFLYCAVGAVNDRCLLLSVLPLSHMHGNSLAALATLHSILVAHLTSNTPAAEVKYPRRFGRRGHVAYRVKSIVLMDWARSA